MHERAGLGGGGGFDGETGSGAGRVPGAHLRGLPREDVVQILLLPELHMLETREGGAELKIPPEPKSLRGPRDARPGPAARNH